MTDNHALARNLFDVGVAAADPYSAVARVLADVQTPSLIIAVGKAATRMAQAALATFSVPCIIVTNYENATPVAGAQVFAAGHPVPDIAGAKAAHAVISALGQAKGSVLVLISGGGSALLPAPAGLLTLSDKSALNKVLLASGLGIGKMNLIRQQVSDVKGGGMLRHCSYPMTALIFSDVVDNLFIPPVNPRPRRWAHLRRRSPSCARQVFGMRSLWPFGHILRPLLFQLICRPHAMFWWVQTAKVWLRWSRSKRAYHRS